MGGHNKRKPTTIYKEAQYGESHYSLTGEWQNVHFKITENYHVDKYENDVGIYTSRCIW